MNKKIWLIFFLLLTGCGTFGGADISPAKRHLWEYKRHHTNMYSMQDETRFGEAILKEQIKAAGKENIAVDPPSYADLRKRIDRIVKKLAQVSDRPDLPYEVHLFDRPKIANAYCLPGGKMGVFTGLVDSKEGLINGKDDNEIAAVLAHEMAHATLRHVTRHLSSMQAWGFLGSLASIAIGQGVNTQAREAFNQVFSLGTNLYLPSYSRKFEKEADQVGLYYMVRAGYDPGAAVKVWQRAAERKGSSAQSTSFFASHPSSGDRARQLEGWLNDARQVKSGQYPH